MRALVSSVSLLVLIWAGPGEALAQQPPPAAASESEEATRLIRRANVAYRAGDYRVALALYEHAYRVERTGYLLFNMAQCHKNLGSSARAIEFYEQYLAAEPSAPNRVAVERNLARLRAQLPAGERPPTTPVPPSAAVPVEPVRPVPTAPVAAATPSPVEVTAVVIPPEPASAPSRPWYRRWYVWAAIGAVVVGGAVGGAVAATRGTSPIPDGYTNLGPLRAFGR